MQHQFGPWILVNACDPLPFGAHEFMFTFVRTHESNPALAFDMLRGFGETEAQAARDAASCLIDADGLPLIKD